MYYCKIEPIYIELMTFQYWHAIMRFVTVLLFVITFAINYDNRYQLMLSCWHSEPQARLNFTQLKYSFKDIIAADSKDTNYITIQPLSPCV